MQTDFKMPPHNIDIEESILASCLLYPDDLEEFVDLLNPNDFYRTAHRFTFAAIVELKQNNKPIDANTVLEELKSNGGSEKVGGGGGIARLLDAPVATNCQYYADLIKGYAIRRLLIEAANTVMKNAYKEDLTPEEILDKAQALVLGLEFKKNGDNNISEIKDLLLEATDRYEQLQKNNCDVTGVPTGFIDLDLVTCGFQNSDFIIIAARPGMGKTALN